MEKIFEKSNKMQGKYLKSQTNMLNEDEKYDFKIYGGIEVSVKEFKNFVDNFNLNSRKK